MPPTLARRLAEAARALADVTETPRLDAELLLAHTLGLTRSQLLARLNTAPDAPGFDALLARRLAREPVAYILGEWEFFSLPLYVEPPLLVPRPETEHLVEAVLSFVGTAPARVLDLCTGTGCVAVAVAHGAPETRVVATDINPQALAVARRNATRHKLLDRIDLYWGDLFEALPEGEPPFDAVCGNPPYVEDAAWQGLMLDIRRYEDPAALLAGPDGLDAIRRIVSGAGARLRPGGLLALELGMGQYGAVEGLLRQHGFADVSPRRDLAGIERIAVARRPAPG